MYLFDIEHRSGKTYTLCNLSILTSRGKGKILVYVAGSNETSEIEVEDFLTCEQQ